MYKNKVTILILIDGFLQFAPKDAKEVIEEGVTILILIDGFLQSKNEGILHLTYYSHNPYFNRWFSAI